MGGGQMMAMAPEWTLAYGLVVFADVGGDDGGDDAAERRAGDAPDREHRPEAPRGGRCPGISTAPFVLGYLAVWLAFAAMATLLQWQLDAPGCCPRRWRSPARWLPAAC